MNEPDHQRSPASFYANAMATAAVFIALGGTSYAALQVTGRGRTSATTRSPAPM
jgi:hypothetical protein